MAIFMSNVDTQEELPPSLVTFEALTQLAATLKSESKTIVHCHGVFDLLHVGHIKYLKEAKKLGDVLVVTLTEDRYVNKGPNRPAFNEALRAEAIASLSCVDYVAINQWPTAIETIEQLRPDLYVKGKDYNDLEKDITGNIKKEKDAVESVGGKLVFTSSELFSSSTLINEYLSSLSDHQKEVTDTIKKNYSRDEILSYFEKMKSLKVGVLGEAIIDRYVYCSPLGKSGKDPILMMHEQSMEDYAGGAIVISNHVDSFVDSVDFFTYLGSTDNLEPFIQSKLASSISMKAIYKQNATTIVKKRFIDQYSHTKLFGTYEFNDSFLSQENEKKLISQLENSSQDLDAFIVADYGHGLISNAVVDTLLSLGKQLCVNTQLNAANSAFHSISKYQKASFVCIHEGELRHEFRDRESDTQSLITKLEQKYHFDNVIITCGNKGAIGYSKKGGFIRVPAFTSQAVDRLGSGDTFLSMCALCFFVGMPMDLTLLASNLAGAFSVKNMGTGTVLPKDYIIKSIETLLK